MSSVLKQWLSNSYLFGANAPFIEDLYETYLGDPQAVTEQWREYFDKVQLLPAAEGAGRDVAHAPIVQAFALQAKAGARSGASAAALDRGCSEILQW